MKDSELLIDFVQVHETFSVPASTMVYDRSLLIRRRLSDLALNVLPPYFSPRMIGVMERAFLGKAQQQDGFEIN